MHPCAPGATFSAVIVLCMIVPSLALFRSLLVLFVAFFLVEPVLTSTLRLSKSECIATSPTFRSTGAEYCSQPHFTLQRFSPTANLCEKISLPHFTQLSYRERKALRGQVGLE